MPTEILFIMAALCLVPFLIPLHRKYLKSKYGPMIKKWVEIQGGNYIDSDFYTLKVPIFVFGNVAWLTKDGERTNDDVSINSMTGEILTGKTASS